MSSEVFVYKLVQIIPIFFFIMERKRKAAYIFFQNLLRKSRKRQRKETEEYEELYSSLLNGPGVENDMDVDGDIIGTTSYATALAAMSNKRCGVDRKNPVNRIQQKELWSLGYVQGNWDDNGFKARLRVTRDTFEFILNEITPFIQKVRTNFQPNPIEPHRQLGLTLYRLAHGCDYQVIDDVFGVSKALGSETFNKVIRVMITT